MKTNKQGFTLIELLVVIAIIGLLSTLSVLALNSARARARDSKRVSDVKQIQTALEMYYNDATSYPAALTSSAALTYNGSTYMQIVPIPPTPADGSCASASTTYAYAQTGTGGSSYTLQYCLGSAVNGINAGINTATPAGIK